MECTFILQLYPSAAQAVALHEAMRSYNAAAEEIVRIAIDQHTSSRVALQRLAYNSVREQFRLPAQLVMGAIGKASTVYKELGTAADRPLTGVQGGRLLCITDLATVSLTTMQGRIVAPFAICGYQCPQLHAKTAPSYLLLRDKVFYCTITREVPSPVPWLTEEEIIAIDLGIRTVETSVNSGQTNKSEEGRNTIHARAP